MNKHSALIKTFRRFGGPIIQAFVNEGIAPREMFQDVGIVDIIQGNMQVLNPTERGPAWFEFPINDRNNMGDIGRLQNLRLSQGLKPTARVRVSAPLGNQSESSRP